MANPNQFQSGTQAISALTGQERVAVDSGGAVVATVSTAQIAALASNYSNDNPQSVTAAVGTTYTTANVLGGLLNRSGPTAAYTDTTPTAVAIVAALSPPSYPISFYLQIKNATAFTQTLQGGTGVTFSSTTVQPANSVSEYLVVVTSATAVVFNHTVTTPIANTIPEVVTPLATNGAGTITGAGIAGRVTQRTTVAAAFTDTTDTAANIIAAQLNAHVGDSWEWVYQNNSTATATLQGGTGVTVSGITVVPAGCSARFLVTYTAAATITISGLSITAPSAVSGTFTANGTTAVTVSNTNISANSVVVTGLKTVGGTPAGQPFMFAVTAGTSFQMKSVAGDTSVYNYLIIN